MRYPASEKAEIIQLVEGSQLPAKRTLDKLGIPRATFYRLHEPYREGGPEALADHRSRPDRVWNRIPDAVRQQIIDLALDLPELSPRELAVRFTDERKYFVSESSVYRLLKAHDLITSPAYLVIKAANEFKDKTTAINQMWQTDFTYLKITGWGWYYLSTVLDDFYQDTMPECDRKLEAVISELSVRAEHQLPPLPKARTKAKQVNALSFDVRAALYGVLGVDLTQIHGLGPSLALKLIGECGSDLQAWPSAKRFTSWLCLAPGNKVSGGKLLSSRTRRSSSRAAALLRLAAVTIGRSDTALGAFYRRLAARIGKQKAVTATARKNAVRFYNTLRFGMTYRDPGASAYDERHRSRVLANLQRGAKTLGYFLAPTPSAECVS